MYGYTHGLQPARSTALPIRWKRLSFDICRTFGAIFPVTGRDPLPMGTISFRTFAIHKCFLNIRVSWHIDCAYSFSTNTKGGDEMKNTKSLLVALILLGNIAVSAIALAADGVISEDVLSTDSYCHEKFPAIEGKSLNSD